jgi:RHS repeat-associated protein
VQLRTESDAADTAIARYRHDPFGNLDCIVTGGTPEADVDAVCDSWAQDQPDTRLRSRYGYDPLDRLLLSRDYVTRDGRGEISRRSEQVYDALNRPTKRAEAHDRDGELREKVTSMVYEGLSDDVVSESQRWTNAPATPSDPDAYKPLTRAYGYDATGQRVSLTSQREGGSEREFSYGHDPHGSVSQLISEETGQARAAYGYTAYGQRDNELTDERDIDDPAKKTFDPNDPANRHGETEPANPYRYSDKRMDTGSGTVDMGARRFRTDVGRFMQADQYEDALADLDLGTDPLTQNRYSLAGGNPVTFIEVDGHKACTATCQAGEHQQTIDTDGEGGRVSQVNPTDPSPPRRLTGSQSRVRVNLASVDMSKRPQATPGRKKSRAEKAVDWGNRAIGLNAQVHGECRWVGCQTISIFNNDPGEAAIFVGSSAAGGPLGKVGTRILGRAAGRLLAGVGSRSRESGGVGAALRKTFEASPKHPDLLDEAGQEALDHSLSFSENTTRRVGVDYERDQFVVFDQTHPGRDIFHGHYRTWDELRAPMRRVLRDANMVDRRGRILRGPGG